MRAAEIRILAMSHSCVTDVNQELFVCLNRLPGVEVELILPNRWKSDYAGGRLVDPSYLPSVDFPLHPLPIRLHGQISLHHYVELPARRFGEGQFDILLAQQEPWSLSGWQAARLARRLKIPFVFQTNQNLLKHYPFPFSMIERQVYSATAIGLAYSEEARKVLAQKGFAGPTAVAPYGTDVSLFTPDQNPRLRAELKLDGSVVIGYMGRLVPEKALDTLIRAFARVRGLDGAPPAKLLFVGSGPEQTALERVAAEEGVLDQLVFTGAVPHKRAGEYMQCMDLFVLPSRTMPNWKEQFGRVIIEAMACAIPVIGSDSGEIPNLIRATGGGRVFHEDDVAGLAEQLRELLADGSFRRKLGESGRRSVQERYTHEAVARQLAALFANHLEGRSATALR